MIPFYLIHLIALQIVFMKTNGLLSIILFTLIISCNPKKTQTVVCTQEARAGLNVTIIDEETKQLIGDSVNVIAAEGTYTETLQYFPGNGPNFSGAWERPGTYIISVTRNMYKTFTSTPINVNKDECHVIAQTLTFSIQAN